MKIQKHAANQHPPSVITTDGLRPKPSNDITQSSKKQEAIQQIKPFSPLNSVFCSLFSLTHQLPGVCVPAHNYVI
jgi:hypothetical protein